MELNEQQKLWLTILLEEVIADGLYSNTSKLIANQILAKLEQ